MSNFDEVLAEVSKLIPSELFARLMQVITEEIEDNLDVVRNGK